MRLAFVLSLVAAAAAAQTDPFRCVPADSLAVVRCQWGPRWRTELGATRFGKTLSDAAFVASLHEALTPLAKELPDHLVRIAKGLGAALDGYAGEVVVAVRADLTTLAGAIDGSKPFDVAGIVLLGADGHSDPAALATKLNELLPRDGATDTKLASGRVDVHHFGSLQVSAFTVHDGCVLALVGQDLARQSEWFLAPERPPFEARPEFRQAIAAGVVEVAGLMPMVPELLPPSPIRHMVGTVWPHLGLGSLRRGGMLLRAAGDHVEQEAWFDVEGAERGVFDVVAPLRAARPKLVHMLPEGTRSFTCSPFDPRALHSLLVRAYEALGDDAPMPRDKVEAEFTRLTKLRLDEDVFALLGDETMSILDLGLEVDPYAEDQDRVTAKVDEKFGDTVYVLALRDGPRFAKNLDTALRARGLHAGRKTEEYAGTKLHRLTILGAFPIEYAVTDSLLVVGVGNGEGTARNLRGVLDTAAAIAAGKSGTPLHEDVAAMIDGMPTDYCGLGSTSLLEVLDGMLANFASLETMLADEELQLSDIEGPWSALVSVGKPLRRALATHRTDLSVTMTLASKTRLTWLTRM